MKYAWKQKELFFTMIQFVLITLSVAKILLYKIIENEYSKEDKLNIYSGDLNEFDIERCIT